MMMKRALVLVIVCSFVFLYFSSLAKNIPFDGHIGQVKSLHMLHPGIEDIVGLAVKDGAKNQSMYVFEGSSGKIHSFTIDRKTGAPVYAGNIHIGGTKFENPRGLAYAREVSGDVFYFLDYVLCQGKSNTWQKGILYRYDATNNSLTFIDLSSDAYQIGTNEIFGVTKQGATLFISFNPSGYKNHNDRIRRGILKISIDEGQPVKVSVGGKELQHPYGWDKALSGMPLIAGHIPGPGKEIIPEGTHPYASLPNLRVEASHALAGMAVDGMEYLWGTVGTDYIYLMEAQTGRGLFYFDKPKGSALPFYDLIAFGDNDLWVADNIDDMYFVYRINVLENPNLPYLGKKRFRELKLQITSNISDNGDTPDGYVYHTFCHPYDSDVVQNQGVIPNSIHVDDKSGVSDFKIEQLYFDPAGDPHIRQNYTLVTYPAEKYPGIRKYVTEFYVKLWKRDMKYFVYPHLAKQGGMPETTYYLEDDTILYNIKSSAEIYEGFIDRVKNYLAEEYNIAPDMQNPYWASRNITEYVLEHYHYPIDSANFWATYDYTKGHYNSHPGDLKAELSADETYEDNIIACSGTGCMVTGLLRFIGIPGLWVGTSNEVYPREGFLEAGGEGAKQVNGHRYNHVWLGELYGWQRFDATPMKPVNADDYYKKPLDVSQWTLMERGPGSKTVSKRVIQNLQSEYWDKMQVPFSGDCMHLVNSCGAVRYNLLGSYSYPELFYYSSHHLRSKAIQFIENINVAVDDKSMATVTWDKSGNWELDPDAKLMLKLEKQCLPGDNLLSEYNEIEILETAIPIHRQCVSVNLGKYKEGTYRMIVAKVGDPAIGNQVTFELQFIK